MCCVSLLGCKPPSLLLQKFLHFFFVHTFVHILVTFPSASFTFLMWKNRTAHNIQAQRDIILSSLFRCFWLPIFFPKYQKIIELFKLEKTLKIIKPNC